MFEVNKGLIDLRSDIKYPEIKVSYIREIQINGEQIEFYGTGKTTCDVGDKFSKDFGIELARARAEIEFLQAYEEYLIDLTKQPEWRKEKPENESTTLNELVGKWAIRTEPCKCRYGSDGSFTTDSIFVRKVTDKHCIYSSKDFRDIEHILTGEWLDNNWIDYDKLMSKDK